MASADISAISMRTFLSSGADEPLNANRLRFSDRKLGDEYEIKNFLPGHDSQKPFNSLLHSPVMGRAFGFGEPSSSKPIHKPTPVHGTMQPQQQTTGFTSNGILPSELSRRTSSIRAKAPHHDEEENGRASSCSDRIADNEVSETMKSSEDGRDSLHHTHKVTLVPTKWQVLYFVAHTKALRIKRTGCELQVTDSANFPLFDVFQKSHCYRSTWILESYGRQVLVIVDASKSFAAKRRNEPQTFNVINSENEEMGNFVTGDPFIIQNAEKAMVARYSAEEPNPQDSRLRNWQCILDGTGQEICVLEQRRTNVYIVKFSGQLGFSLKLMVLAAAVQIVASPNSQRKTCCNVM